MDVKVSKEGRDPKWDRFLETMPDGCYQQSSLWAEVQAVQGWSPLRVVVQDGETIVGGVQMLLRTLPVFGAVGYVSRGPVFASSDPETREFILDQMDRVARQNHVLLLKIQPAYQQEALAEVLMKRGALPSDVRVTPLATLWVDLSQDEETLSDNLYIKTRSNIRRAERRGVSVRRGTDADFPTFLEMLMQHSQEHHYTVASKSYYRAMQSVMGPPGYAQFFIAEYEGQPLAISTYIAFGDVIVNKLLVDNGEHRNLNAPSLLHWKAMLWAKEQGLTWYDFGGIEKWQAKAIQDDEAVDDNSLGRRAKFKALFGGEVIFRPGVYDLSYVWPRRLTVRMVPVLLKMKPLLGALVGQEWAQYLNMHKRAATRLAEEHTEDGEDRFPEVPV